MNISQLTYLHFIVTRGSFAAAARHAGVSQPAITQAMQTLEEALGIRLFEKIGRQKVPTPAARDLAQHVSRLHGQIERLKAQSAGAEARTASTPVLRIGMAPAAALLYGPMVERLWRLHEAEGLLQVVSGSAPELLSQLEQEELDLAIAPRPRRHRAAGLRYQTLYTSMPTVYARTGHPLAHATSLRDIESAGWVVSGRGGTAGNVIEEAHRVRRMRAPRILVQCADYAAVLDLVACTDLLCVVPHPVLLHKRHRTALQALALREGLPQYEVCLFWYPEHPCASGMAVNAIVEALAREGTSQTRTPRRAR